jgi:hypothetical protein
MEELAELKPLPFSRLLVYPNPLSLRYGNTLIRTALASLAVRNSLMLLSL